MSRVGSAPITIESTVKLEKLPEVNRFGGSDYKVSGPKGELIVSLRPVVDLELSDGEANIVTVAEKAKRGVNMGAMQGLYRSLVNNAVEGVTSGYSKELEIVGIGYKAEPQGRDLKLTIGLNHPVIFSVPEGIDAKVADGVRITISGIDKQLVGEVAARIRRLKRPEPYKGKGIRYVDEVVRRKAGKTAA